MTMVKVYRFQKYDITTDQKRRSHRWATSEAIKDVNGEPLAGTEIEVDDSVLDPDMPGMTRTDFNPKPRTGFQTVVNR